MSARLAFRRPVVQSASRAGLSDVRARDEPVYPLCRSGIQDRTPPSGFRCSLLDHLRRMPSYQRRLTGARCLRMAAQRRHRTPSVGPAVAKRVVQEQQNALLGLVVQRRARHGRAGETLSVSTGAVQEQCDARRRCGGRHRGGARALAGRVHGCLEPLDRPHGGLRATAAHVPSGPVVPVGTVLADQLGIADAEETVTDGVSGSGSGLRHALGAAQVCAGRHPPWRPSGSAASPCPNRR